MKFRISYVCGLMMFLAGMLAGVTIFDEVLSSGVFKNHLENYILSGAMIFIALAVMFVELTLLAKEE